MRETEVTVQCFNSLNEIFEILQNSGWVEIAKFQLNDWYFSKCSLAELKEMNYAELLINSFLVREMIKEGVSENSILYKSKFFDNNGNVISEVKTSSRISDIKSTLQIYKNAGLTMWCGLENTSYVYKKNNVEFVIQEVKDVGIFIELEEYEDIKDCSDREKFEILVKNLQSTNLDLGNDFSCKKVFMKFHS